MEAVGQDLVHVFDEEADAAVGIGVGGVLFAQVAPDGHVVVGPVGVVEEDLEGKVKEVVVHVDGGFKGPLVGGVFEVGGQKLDDLGPGVDVDVAAAVFFDGVGDLEAEGAGYVVVGGAGGDVADGVEFAVEEHDAQAVFGQAREAAFVGEHFGVLVADAADVEAGDAVGPEFDLGEGIKGVRGGIKRRVGVGGGGVRGPLIVGGKLQGCGGLFRSRAF